MGKKIFPGGTTAKMREEEQRRKEEEKKQKQEERKEEKAREAREKAELLKNIGPATRILMLRRGAGVFLIWLAAQIGLGSLCWATINKAPNDQEQTYRTYTEALTSAYNPANLFDGDKYYRKPRDFAPDAFETWVAFLLLGAAAAMAVWQHKKDTEVAKQTVQCLELERRKEYYSSIPMNLLQYKSGPYSSHVMRKLHPVCRAVVRNMSTQHPELFNRLMAGKTGDATRDYMIAVIRGHLESHPEDFKKVLELYEEESLPKSLIRDYGQRTK